jgi:hypothetical protein
MRKSHWIVLAAVFGCLTLGFLAAQSKVAKLSAYGFAVQKGDSTVIVDMDLARYRGNEKFIPLQVVVGNTGAQTLHMTRSTFTLTDPAGHKHPVATVQEITKGYGPSMVSNDYSYYRHSALGDYWSSRFQICQFIPKVAFYANSSGGPRITYDQVELPRNTYTKTMLYFANPDGKAKGTYTLTYDDPKSGTVISIPFSIPWHK